MGMGGGMGMNNMGGYGMNNMGGGMGGHDDHDHMN